MGDTPGLFSEYDERREPQARPPAAARVQQPPTQPPGLVPCPDCARPCSRYAESCPQCGRFFQSFARAVQVVNEIDVSRSGWSWTVAGGVILASIISATIGVVVGFLLLVLFGVSLAALVRPHG